MNKLLGKNYKWWVLASYIFKVRTNYRLDTFFSIFGGIIKFIGSLLVWVITIRAGANLDLEEVLTYFILGSIFGQFVNSIVEYDLAGDIKNGKLTNKLLNSSSIFGQYFWWSLGGDAFYSFWNSLALGLVAAFCWPYLAWTGLTNLFLAFLLVILARLIVFWYQILTGCAAFWSTEAGGILRTTGWISLFCSGALFPLDAIKETEFLQFLPFSYLFYHPMQIYLGKYSPKEALIVFLGGIFWCCLLYFLAKKVFQAGLKRNESVGL